ncbi:DNA-binding SARP family transcriptional activator [Stackebrandtia albiflava]|uniref:DNA-binding SARP family transcriptional activator n=1 Tax=Stackebrandtia albiflava TaxID=406432 RepID=A0A562VBF4_9ACTN|nr:DNA-binding SARP family transcriptional activator [Stackebrandtia albiflava]
MRFAILGDLAVENDTGPVVLAAAKQRRLLAALLSRPGRPVPADTLIDQLWSGETPPGAPDKALRWHVLRLRAALGDKDVIRWHADGYRLTAAEEDVDAARFLRGVREGAALADTDPASAHRLLSAALAEWRGPAFHDLADGIVQPEAERLEELRLVAVEQRCGIDLRLGRHAHLIPELTGLVAEHPFREAFRHHLMLALYRSGRQADALQLYRDGRTRLAEELGLDPGPRLRELERRILAADPELDPPAVSAGVAGPPQRVPSELPADLTGFVGRDAELAEAERLADAGDGVVTVVVDGMAGVGKSTFCVRLAHRLAERYPDGRIFLNLHGFGDVPSLSAHAALGRVLRSFGVPDDRIPEDVDHRAALFRTTVADRRVMLVLDNVADEEHVRPLVPGAGRHLVLVSSRRRLPGLDGAVAVSLRPFDADRAVEMFRRVSGVEGRTEAERLAMVDIVRLCGELPLAVRIAAGRFRARPNWTLAGLRERLTDEGTRLAQLELGSRSVESALMVSHRDLDADRRRLLTLLGGYPGGDFDAYAAAALWGSSVSYTELQLERLVEVNLLSEPSPGRFQFHDLVRAFATQRLAELPEDVRSAAMERLAEYYRLVSRMALETLMPHMFEVSEPSTDAFRPETPDLTEAPAERAWFDADHHNFLPVLHSVRRAGLLRDTWKMGRLFTSVMNYHSDFAQMTEISRLGLAAARELRDGEAEAELLRMLGNSLANTNQYTAATDAYREAVRLCREHGDRAGEALNHNNIGIVFAELGEEEDARAAFRLAVEMSAGAGPTRGLYGLCLSNLLALTVRGERFETARKLLAEARELFRELDNPYIMHRLDNAEGLLLTLEGGDEASLRLHETARRFFEGIGETAEIANSEGFLAVAYDRLGRPDEAMRHHRRALRIAAPLGHRSKLAGLAYEAGKTAVRMGEYAIAAQWFGEAEAMTLPTGNAGIRRAVREETAKLKAMTGRNLAPRDRSRLNSRRQWGRRSPDRLAVPPRGRRHRGRPVRRPRRRRALRPVRWSRSPVAHPWRRPGRPASPPGCRCSGRRPPGRAAP